MSYQFRRIKKIQQLKRINLGYALRQKHNVNAQG